jgi:8-oxo-dGTP diphosphatase
MGSGDGWTTCGAGHRHWGLFGAAGLLITDGSNVILQHRAAWTHEGDTWGVLGGARDHGEDAVTAALREANEEAGLLATEVTPIGLYVDDHRGWAYTTVVARPAGVIEPRAANAESVSVRWHEVKDVAQLPLHTGFAAAWHHLRTLPLQLYLIVLTELATDARVGSLARNGIGVEHLPSGVDAGGLNCLLPTVVACADLAAAAALTSTLADRGQVILATEPADLELLY